MLPQTVRQNMLAYVDRTNEMKEEHATKQGYGFKNNMELNQVSIGTSVGIGEHKWKYQVEPGSKFLVTTDWPYQSTKDWDHNLGISCAFRQWRAKSHCNQIHGYALAVRLVFEAKDLDELGWVVDFGSLKPIKQWLEHQFDHRLVVAADDPELDTFKQLHEKGIVNLNVLTKGVGCERFAEYVAQYVDSWLSTTDKKEVRLKSVEVKEHGANSAVFVLPRYELTTV